MYHGIVARVREERRGPILYHILPARNLNRERAYFKLKLA